ncbi:MAG: TadE family protein [Planctomycetota bacterium]
MTTRHRRRLPDRRRGAAATEFAIVAPVFFLVVFSLFEFTWLNIVRHTADNAAYEAARVAIVPGATAGDAVAEAERILRTVGVRSATVTVDPSTITTATDRVTVTVDAPFDANAIITPIWAGGATLTSNATLLAERVRSRAAP